MRLARRWGANGEPLVRVGERKWGERRVSAAKGRHKDRMTTHDAEDIPGQHRLCQEDLLPRRDPRVQRSVERVEFRRRSILRCDAEDHERERRGGDEFVVLGGFDEGDEGGGEVDVRADMGLKAGDTISSKDEPELEGPGFVEDGGQSSDKRWSLIGYLLT